MRNGDIVSPTRGEYKGKWGVIKKVSESPYPNRATFILVKFSARDKGSWFLEKDLVKQ
jgi:ribosomal protein L24